MNKKDFIIRTLIVVFIAYSAVLFASIIIDNLFYPEISIKVCEEYNTSDSIFSVNGDLFRSADGKIINLNTGKMILNADHAKGYNDKIWAFDSQNGYSLSCVDTSGNTISKYDLDKSLDDFMIADLTLLTVSSEGINAYELGNTLTKTPIKYTSLFKTDNYEIFSFTYNDIMCVWLDTQSYDLNYENSYYAVNLSSSECIFKNGKYQILSADKNSVIFTDINDDKNEILIFDEGSKTLKSVEYDGFNIFEKAQNFSTKDKIYWVGQENTSRKFEKDASLKACDDMKNHKHDVLLTIDKNNPDNIDRWETKTFERILYVDDRVIITYYKGKFVRYLTDSKEKINENDSEIKDPGSYSTQSCGFYLFIIDSDGNIIQKTIIG